MRTPLRAALAVSVYIGCFAAAPAFAVSPLNLQFGNSWDGPSHSLQKIVDSYIGAPGAIDVETDYMGAHAGDPDPWFWLGASVPVLMITEVAGNAGTNELGWYLENGSKPVIDGIDDGIVFTGAAGAGASTTVSFGSPMTRFGFYLNPHRPFAGPGGASRELFFTNRKFNDFGYHGQGAVHAPFDGDVQAIVFDVSRWRGPNTWLVCFEDLDAGLPLTSCCSGTDDDYNDMVFQVKSLGATPVRLMSFGELKARYR